MCTRSLGNALIESLVGLVDLLLQIPVSHEVAGGLIEMRHDGLHGHHAIAEQPHVRIEQTQSAAEHAPQPVIQRLGQTDAMARLCHL